MATKHSKLILELNNIDILGRRFNGYNLLEYFSIHKSQRFHLKMLVNNRKSYSSKSKNLFSSPYVEEYDWIVQAAERNLLKTKNQLSLSEPALTSNKYYHNAKILHFHLYHNINLPIEFLTRIPPEKQIIIDIHDTYWLTDSNIPMLEVFNYTNPNQKSQNAQRKRVLESIDAHYVVHSPYIYRLFKKSDATKNLKNVSLINFGINTKTFKPLKKAKIEKLRAKLNIPADNIVLFCRAQSNFKGAPYIIEALSKLKNTEKITILTVVEVGLFKELSDKYQVIDLGVVYNDAKMNELFNICDIFLSPSTEESFGFMPAEAMACGKPVVVFDGTALPDTTGAPEIGIVSKRNSTDLADKIQFLIDNPKERKNRGKLAISFVKKNYNLNQYYKEYQKLFKELLKNPPRKVKPSKKTSSKVETEKFKKIMPVLQAEIDNPQAKIPPNWKTPIIDYNDQGVQSLIYDFNKYNYEKLQNIPRKLRIKYKLKRIIPEPVINTTKRIGNGAKKIIPSPAKRILKEKIRRK